MSDLYTVKLPDIGDISAVEIIELLVSEGDVVAVEDSLITVESDKASMEIPSPVAGKISRLLIKVGSEVGEGADLMVIETEDATADATSTHPSTDDVSNVTDTQSAEAGSGSHDHTDGLAATATPSSTAPPSDADITADLVVLGAGPGGYTAAFRAADLGLSVVLIERYPDLGGVCLNVGCIPSKALLHTGQIINEAADLAEHGVVFNTPAIDVDKLRHFKEKVITQLTSGLKGLAKQRKVTVVQGVGAFASPHTVTVTGPDESTQTIGFGQAIIAAGSQSVKIPGFPYNDERLMDSTGALALADIPKRLLVIGGGIIGLEMGCVYDALGSAVTVVELSDGLMPGADRDLVRPLEKRLKKRFESIYVNSKVTAIDPTGDGLTVSFEGGEAPASDTFDRVLLSVGRSPNGHNIEAGKAGVAVTERGFIEVDGQQRTNIPHIFAIGDIVGQPMLAHKATHEGKTAAEVAAGMKSWFDARTIPSVAYTDPEVAWMGLTETDAKAQGIAYEKGVFPWAASGRSLANGRNEGLTKVLYDSETGQLLGAGITGSNAGELIAEAVLALEMGADIQDIALTIHPHPTLSETLNFACEVAEGTVTDLYVPKKSAKH